MVMVHFFKYSFAWIWGISETLCKKFPNTIKKLVVETSRESWNVRSGLKTLLDSQKNTSDVRAKLGLLCCTYHLKSDQQLDTPSEARQRSELVLKNEWYECMYGTKFLWSPRKTYTGRPNPTAKTTTAHPLFMDDLVKRWYVVQYKIYTVD